MHTRNSLLSSALRPLQAFLAAESAGGIVLLAAALAALVWANSPWGDTYAQVWHAKLAIAVGEHRFAMSLEHWVNDGLMAVFFLLVGLEIKRELLVGELASLRRAARPVAAAIGGIVLPALIYLLFTARGPGARGWGRADGHRHCLCRGRTRSGGQICADLREGVPAGRRDRG